MTRLAIVVAFALLALILFTHPNDSGLPVEATTANAPAPAPDATVTASEETVTAAVSPDQAVSDTTLPTTELQGAVGPATIVTKAEPVERPRQPAPEATDHIWWKLAMCESGRDGQPRWTFNGLHQGGLQYAPSTWDSYRPDDYPEEAYDATPQQQIDVGRLVLAAQGPGAWPICGPRVGLRRGM